MSALTPLALQNADLLRALDAGGFGSIADLARKFGRDKDNFRKTLKALERDGLVVVDADAEHPLPVLSSAGRTALAALARADNPNPPPQGEGDRAAVEGVATLLHEQIWPDPLNPRKHFDEEALAELADSIAQDGLLENLVVRTGETDHGGGVTSTAPIHRLVAGERRWRAIRKLIQDGRWPEDRAILCKVVEIDDAAHRRLALVENLQRKDLRPIDEAEALKALIAVTQQTTAEVAKEIGFTQRFVQQRLQLLDLPEAKREALNDGDITIEDARRIIAQQNAAREAAERKRLPKDELLAMAEIFDACRVYGESLPGWYMGTKPVAVGHRALDDGDPIARLIAKGFVSHQPGWRSDARHFVYPCYPFVEKDMEAQLPGWAGKDRLRVYRALRCQVLGADEGHRISDTWSPLSSARGEYATWGLNAPFNDTPDPALEAAAEAARTEEQERTNADFDRKCAELKAKAEREQEDARDRQRLTDVRAFEDTAHGLDHADFTRTFAELLQRFEIPAPYALTWDEERSDPKLVDANAVWFAGHGAGLEARRRLLAIALNYAAGCDAFSGEDLPTPWSGKPSGEDPEDGDPAILDDDEDDDPALLDEDEAEGLEAAAGDDPPAYLRRLAGGAPQEAQP